MTATLPADSAGRSTLENTLVRNALRGMLAGTLTPNGAAPDFGGWADFMAQVHSAYTARGAAGARDVVNVNPAALRLLSGDEPTAQPGYRVLDRAALRAAARRQPVYLYDGFVEADTTAMIYGDWGTGKSFYAVHIAATVAQSSNVLYIAAEGARGIAKRVDVWELHNHKQADRLFVIGEVVDVERRLADILSVIDRLRPSLVIWDTLSRHMSIAGWNENFANEYGLFHARLDSIRNEYGCSHLVVHHVSRAGNERGSTQIPGNMDSIDLLERHGQLKGVVSITPKKRKDDLVPAETWHELRTYETGNVDETTGRPILDTNGQPETSCVLMPINLADKVNMAPAALRQIMAAIDGGNVTPKQIETATGIPPRSVARALKKMLDDGLVTSDGKGRYTVASAENEPE